MKLTQLVLKPNASNLLPVDEFYIIKSFDDLEEYRNSFAQSCVLNELTFSPQIEAYAQIKGVSCAEAAVSFNEDKFNALEKELSNDRIVLINSKGGWQSIKREDVQYYTNEF